MVCGDRLEVGKVVKIAAAREPLCKVASVYVV